MGGEHQAPALLEVDGGGDLAEDVQAGVEGGGGLRGVEVHRRGHDHGVEAAAGEQVVERGEGVLGAGLAADLLQALGVGVADGGDAGHRLPGREPRQEGPPPGAGAGDADVELLDAVHGG